MSNQDWCSVGNDVRDLKGNIIKIVLVTEDNGVYSVNGTNYCRTELTPLNNGLNGYRWGVEYPTNSKKPDLPDDFIVCIDRDLSTSARDSVAVWNWAMIKSFRITDQRYKPADTSYLVSETPESKSNAENVSDWYDYEAQKAVALPPVDLICESFNHQRDEWVKVKTLKAETKSKELACVTLESEGHWGWLFWGCKFRPLDHNRKAEAEKKRVVDAVVSAWSDIPDMTDFKECFSKLYDLGYLRMSEDKQ